MCDPEALVCKDPAEQLGLRISVVFEVYITKFCVPVGAE